MFIEATIDEKFLPILAIAKDRSRRLELLERENLGLAARFRNKHPKEYAVFIGALSAWEQVSYFKTEVTRRSAAMKRALEEDEKNAEAMERLAKAELSGRPLLSEGHPVSIAREFLASVRPNIIASGGEWLDYVTNHYEAVERQTVRSSVQQWMETAVSDETGNKLLINRRVIDDVMDALLGLVHRPAASLTPPMWLDATHTDPDPKYLIAFKDGLLDMRTGVLHGNTPRFFTRNGLAFDRPDPDPYFHMHPENWLHFLESVWPEAEGGKQNHDALQEMMGYLLTGSTEYQKIFAMVGPPRCGKGTIARVITAMLSKVNVASQSVTKLGKDFGAAALIGKQLLIVPDLRLGRDANIGGITEFLLNISGEDDVSVSRKFKDEWEGRLNVRTLLLMNAELVLPDQSGALASRLIPLVMHKSFTDRMDTALTGKLLVELPDILRWAIEGLQRLEARRDGTGRKLGFVLTDDGRKLLDDIRAHGSSVKAFVSECCIMEPDAYLPKSALYEAFEGWCRAHDVQSHLVPETFTKELKVATGRTVESVRRRIEGEQVYCYGGLRLKPEFEDHDWPD